MGIYRSTAVGMALSVAGGSAVLADCSVSGDTATCTGAPASIFFSNLVTSLAISGLTGDIPNQAQIQWIEPNRSGNGNPGKDSEPVTLGFSGGAFGVSYDLHSFDRCGRRPVPGRQRFGGKPFRSVQRQRAVQQGRTGEQRAMPL